MVKHRVWVFMLAVLVGGSLGFPVPSTVHAEDGPIVCIDLQTSSTPSPGTISSTYYGSGPAVYAFLVVTETPNSISAIVAGFEIEGTGVLNGGFTFLEGWGPASDNVYGLSPQPNGPGSECPIAVGYWTLFFTDGGASSATLSLLSPGGLNGDAVIVVDGEKRARVAAVVRHAGINTNAPSETIQASVEEFLATPAHHVLTMYRHNALQLPEGLIGAPLETITSIDSSLFSVLDQYAPIRVDKVFPARLPADSLIVRADAVIRAPELWRIIKLTLADSLDVPDLINDLDLPELITYAEPNTVGEFVTLEPDDDYYPDAWHLNNTGQEGGVPDADINAPEAWQITTGSSDVVVCIVDSGIDRSHPDFATRTIVGDTEFVGDHGTNVFGVLGASTNNEIGVAGVDWNCTLMSQFTDTTVAMTAPAIDEAVDGGANIISLSLAFPRHSETIRRAVHRAFLRGTFTSSATGNQGLPDSVRCPAHHTEIVASVGGSNRFDQVMFLTNRGERLEYLAPGHQIWTTGPNGTYVLGSGTSDATPIVAGIASLMLSVDPSLTDVDIDEILKATVKDLGPEGFDTTHGWGRVDAYAALQFLEDRALYHVSVPAESVAQEVPPTGWITIHWRYPPYNYPSGDYFVRRYQLRGQSDLPVPMSETAMIWPRLIGTGGFRSASAGDTLEFDFSWAEIVEVDSTTVDLRTFVYEVRAMDQTPIGWWPVAPEEVTFAYTVAEVRGSTSVGEPESVRRSPSLVRLNRNPAVHGGTASFGLLVAEPSQVVASIHDANGRRVRTLTDREVLAGRHHLEWDGRDDAGQVLPAGIFFLRCTVNDVVLGRKVTILE